MEPSSRKVVKRSPARTVRLLNLPDLQSTAIECESALERDFVQVASVFYATRWIQHQPFKIELLKGSYTPDFLVRFQDESAAVVEVKPSSRIEEHIEKLTDAAIEIRNAGWPFLVVDETRIQLEGMAKQARLIRRYAKASFPVTECVRAVDIVREVPAITVQTLRQAHGFPLPLLLHLIAHRQISCSTGLSTDDTAELVNHLHIQQDLSHAIQFGSWLGTAPWQAHA